MAIYYGHFSPMPLNFRPPRAGSMPARTVTPTFLGPNQYQLKDEQRNTGAIGMPHLKNGAKK